MVEVADWQPLVVHRYRCVGAHGEEVCIDPALAFVELVAELSGPESVVFADAPLPEAAALGALPAGFIEGRAVDTETLVEMCRHRADVLLSAASKEKGEKTTDSSSREDLDKRIKDVFSAAVAFTLWDQEECFQTHTKPAMIAGAGRGALTRALAWGHCHLQRRSKMKAANEQLGRWKRPIIADLSEFLKDIYENHLARRAYLFGSSPQVSDLLLAAYCRPLLATPLTLIPWASVEMKSNLEHLRAFSRKLGPLRSRVEGFEPETLLSLWLPPVNKEERRKDPLLGDKELTFAEIRHAHAEKLLTEVQLHQHWVDLQPDKVLAPSEATAPSDKAKRMLMILGVLGLCMWSYQRRRASVQL